MMFYSYRKSFCDEGMKRFNLPIWTGVGLCLMNVCVTVVHYGYFPEVSDWSHQVHDQHVKNGTIHRVHFEEAWLIHGLMLSVGRYVIPCCALIAVLFALWGQQHAKKLKSLGMKHPSVSFQVAEKIPWLVLVVGLLCILLGWLRIS